MDYRYKIAFVFYLLMAGSAGLLAQDSIRNKLKAEATQRFDSHDYTSALSSYRELLTQFPKEPEYVYRTGVCLILLNQDLDEAINLMRPLTLSGYDPMSWYYLGRACHLSYLFDEAIKAYNRFIIEGKAEAIKTLAVERQIEMAKNGIELTKTGQVLNIQDAKNLSMDQLESASGINGSGKMMRKPVEFCSKNDLREGYRPLVFLPAFTEINDYIYLAGYEKAGKLNKQLFRVKNIGHVNWGIPEPLDNMINTPYDDEFPYFDVKASVLYFSSKGHSSMGGYDIFKSVYDWNTKSWSKPENMGFPINSPYDDFIFITDEFRRNATFASNRNTGPGQAILYKISLDKDKAETRFFSVDEIKKASMLTETRQDIPKAEPEKAVDADTAKTDEAMVTEPTAPEPVTQDIKPAPLINDYNSVLADALVLQLKADSLSRIAREKRLLAKETPDEDLKKQLMAEIIQADKDAKSVQREADAKFVEARNLKEPEPLTAENDNSAVVLAKEIDGTRVYQYQSGPIPEETAEQVLPPDNLQVPAGNEVHTVPARVDDFAMLEKSPYGPANPIPQGLTNFPGLIYRVQLGVFSKVRPDDAFGGISPVCFVQAGNGNVLKYYAGVFYTLNSVNAALEIIRSKGYPDAFIVAFLDAKPITTEKAREIEFQGFKIQ